jgi:hypothetical protein
VVAFEEPLSPFLWFAVEAYAVSPMGGGTSTPGNSLLAIVSPCGFAC